MRHMFFILEHASDLVHIALPPYIHQYLLRFHLSPQLVFREIIRRDPADKASIF